MLSSNIDHSYNLGKSPGALSLREMELCITAAVLGMGPTRQAKNHMLGCIGFEFTSADLKALLSAASDLADWAGKHFDWAFFDVDAIAAQGQNNLS